MLLDDVPCAQVMQLPQQLVYLSRDRINFGEVPVGCLLRGIVIVHNTSKRSVSFRWMLTDLPEGLVSVEPVAGPLKSGQSAICRLVYQPSFEPRIYETDVCCEIMDEDEAVGRCLGA